MDTTPCPPRKLESDADVTGVALPRAALLPPGPERLLRRIPTRSGPGPESKGCTVSSTAATGHFAPGIRYGWIDAARGIAILLVVIYHATLTTQALGFAVGPWEPIALALRTLRMPLFFLVSGLLTAGYLDRSWTTIAGKRLTGWMWLYLLWSLITFAVFSVVPWRRGGPGPAGSLSKLVGIVTAPESGLWYLYALAIFLILIRLTRRVPGAVIVGVGALASTAVGANWITTGNFAFDDMIKFFMFFALGARFRDHIVSVVERAAPRTSIVVLAASVAALVAMVALVSWGTGLPPASSGDVPLVSPAASILVTSAALMLAKLISSSAITRPVTRLGINTLPVYVTHEILLGCIAEVLFALGGPRSIGVGWAAPVVLASVAIAAGIGIHRLLGRVPGLYAPPAALTVSRTRRADRHPTRARSAVGGQSSAGGITRRPRAKTSSE